MVTLDGCMDKINKSMESNNEMAAISRPAPLYSYLWHTTPYLWEHPNWYTYITLVRMSHANYIYQTNFVSIIGPNRLYRCY